MSTIEEIIRKQALAVKTNSNNTKAMSLIKQALSLIEPEKTPAAFNLVANTEKQYAAIDRFGKARAKIQEQDKAKLLADAHTALTADGWKPIARNPTTGTGAYKHDSLPGHELKVEGEHFSVSNGADLVVPKTHLKNLKPTLKKLKPL